MLFEVSLEYQRQRGDVLKVNECTLAHVHAHRDTEAASGTQRDPIQIDWEYNLTWC